MVVRMMVVWGVYHARWYVVTYLLLLFYMIQRHNHGGCVRLPKTSLTIYNNNY